MQRGSITPLSNTSASSPDIPFGAKRVFGQSQQGDRYWNGERWRKVTKNYPFAGDSGLVIIRKCEVTQTEMPEVVTETMEVEW